MVIAEIAVLVYHKQVGSPPHKASHVNSEISINIVVNLTQDMRKLEISSQISSIEPFWTCVL